MNNKETWWSVVIVLLTLVLLAGAGFIVYLAGTLVIKIAVAVIGVAGGIIAAIANHTLQLEKDRISAQHLAKQENYKNLLSKVGDFARGVDSGDALTSAHLASWAFGDMEVLFATNEFQKSKSRDSLVILLRAVRRSLQAEDLPPGFLTRYDPGVLFPKKETGLD